MFQFHDAKKSAKTLLKKEFWKLVLFSFAAEAISVACFLAAFGINRLMMKFHWQLPYRGHEYTLLPRIVEMIIINISSYHAIRMNAVKFVLIPASLQIVGELVCCYAGITILSWAQFSLTKYINELHNAGQKIGLSKCVTKKSLKTAVYYSIKLCKYLLPGAILFLVLFVFSRVSALVWWHTLSGFNTFNVIVTCIVLAVMSIIFYLRYILMAAVAATAPDTASEKQLATDSAQAVSGNIAQLILLRLSFIGWDILGTAANQIFKLLGSAAVIFFMATRSIYITGIVIGLVLSAFVCAIRDSYISISLYNTWKETNQT